MTDAHGVARDQLRAFIERIERLEEEKKTIADDIKDVYGEAKGFGYDTKAIRTIIRLRKKDANERAEEEAILDSYMAALGMIDQHDLFDETVAAAVEQNTRSPAMALRSPRKAAEAVSERTAFTSATVAPVLVEADEAEAVAGVLGQPETIPALTVQHDGVNVGGPERAGVTDRRDDHLNFETCERCQGNGEIVTDWDRYKHPYEGDVGDEAVSECPDCGGEGVIDVSTDTEIASASQGEAEATTPKDVSLPADGASSEGASTGGDHVTAHPSTAATAGALVKSAPAIKHRFRPNCQRRDHCKSGTADHCHSCRQAMREGSAA